MTILLVVGVLLVVFGGLVLLFFPDRPGGKVGWHDFEVSSVGAGLPVIVVGVVAVGFAAVNGHGFGLGGPSAVSASSGSSSAASAGCLGGVFHGIPVARTTTVEAGASAEPAVRGGEGLSGPVGLRLTDSGRTVGGVAFSYFPTSQLFKIASVVDAACKPVSDLEDVDRPSQDPHSLANWDTLALRLDGKLYDLRLGSAPALEATFTPSAAP